MGKDAEDDSAPKSIMEKSPGTPDMTVREAEDMVNSMLLDSSLLDTERSDEKLPKDGGSDKLPEEDSEKLPEGGCEKQPEEAPVGKPVPLCTLKKYFSLLLN